MTQEELAFRASVSRSYVSLLELDRKSPTVDTLLRIAGAMDAKASALIEQVERQLPPRAVRRTDRARR